MLANISEETNCDVLALANVTYVGFAFAMSTNSFKFLAGPSLFTATMRGT